MNSIEIMPIPKTPKEFREMLWLTGYYRKFISASSDLVRPLTQLTRRHVSFIWKDKGKKSCEMLKQSLMYSKICLVHCADSCNKYRVTEIIHHILTDMYMAYFKMVIQTRLYSQKSMCYIYGCLEIIILSSSHRHNTPVILCH